MGPRRQGPLLDLSYVARQWRRPAKTKPAARVCFLAHMAAGYLGVHPFTRADQKL